MAISTTAGTKIYIGPVREPTVDTAGEYAGLAYVEIGEVENLGEFGDESTIVTFLSVGDSRTRKLKGSRDAGTISLTVGRDPFDAGQEDLNDAEATKFEYAFKVVVADAPDVGYADSVFYFGALVASARGTFNGADDVTRKSYQLAINTPIIEVPSAAL